MIASFFTGRAALSLAADARSTIGIDVGSHAIKAVQVTHSPGGLPRLVAAASRPRAGTTGVITAGESAALSDALRMAGFRGRNVVLSAPQADAAISGLDLPPRSSNAPLDQIARMEVARNSRVAPDSFEMAWWELPRSSRSGRGTRALAAAVPHQKADVLIDAVESARLEVDALDLEPMALMRACGPALAPEGITAILDLGMGPASLTFVFQQTVVFNRRLTEIAIGAIPAELCRRLSIEPDIAEFLLAEVGVGDSCRARTADGEAVEIPEEGRRVLVGFVDAMTRELSLSFDYAAHLYPDMTVNRLLLVGGGAAMTGLPERLTASLPVEVRVVTPVDLAACDSGLMSVAASPAFTLALGLALHEQGR